MTCTFDELDNRGATLGPHSGGLPGLQSLNASRFEAAGELVKLVGEQVPVGVQWVKVEETTYTDPASGRHRLGRNLYVVTEADQRALAEHDQQAMAEHTVSAGHVSRQWPPIAGRNKRTLLVKRRR